MNIEDLSALTVEEQADEDDSSDPDEDPLGRQMVTMRGGSIHSSSTREAEDSDEESRGSDSDWIRMYF